MALNFISGTGGKTFKHTPLKPLAQVRSTVQIILENYRPAMQKLVADAGTMPHIPSWIPKVGSGHAEEKTFRDHITKLAIPNVKGMPSLLLHDLCIKAGAVDEKESKHIAEIFSHDDHMCVDNSNSLRFADLNTIESSSTLLALGKPALVSVAYARIGGSMPWSGKVRMTSDLTIFGVS